MPGIATYERQAALMQRQLHDLRLAADVSRHPQRTALAIAAQLGLTLDDWQRDGLSTDMDLLMLVTRQGGKGMVASLLALEAMISRPGSTTVIIAPAERQSKRLLRRIRRHYHLIPDRVPVLLESSVTIELRNGAEVMALPGSEETIRGIEAVDLLIVDEAALVDDDLMASVTPMLITTNGRTAAFSTARGKRGWFWKEYTGDSPDWYRARVTAPDIPRISPDRLAKERSRIGEFMYRQEYLCEFLDNEDQLFGSDLVDAAVNPNLKAWAF